MQAPQSDTIYDDCGSTKSCFGFPDGCVATRSCNAVGTVFVRGDIYQFEMKSGFSKPKFDCG